jgi:D-sedoheptulose 7-phosphate isomerase
MPPEGTDFLYPFIEANERDIGSLIADLARSAEGKAVESRRLAHETLTRDAAELDVISEKISSRFAAGGMMFTFGNGGSATDAAAMAALFVRPPRGRPFPARSLLADQATLTALGNDVGFDLVFSRQVIAHGRKGDVAVGFSTSGNSDNVVMALTEARRRQMLTIGFAGYDGGQMAHDAGLDHCLVVRSDSIHRIQETEDALVLSIWSRVQELTSSREGD